MNTTLPIRFYQVKRENETIEELCNKFGVRPEKIERDSGKTSADPLTVGEMLCVRNF